MAAIKDVAKLAGVSISTVSKYLNNAPNLTEEYREKVEKAINELHYIPSSTARALRTQKTYTIAMIVPELSNYFYTDLFYAVQTCAAQNGYRIILYSLDNNPDIFDDLINNIPSAQVDGIIAAFPEEFADINNISLNKYNLPLVLFSTDIEGQNYSAAIIDVTDSEYRATKYFLDKGHKKVAYVNGPVSSKLSLKKIAGYKKALENARIPVEDRYIYHGSYRSSTGFQAARQFMSQPEPPTAIVCANDILAIGCIKYLLRANYKIPEDVAIIGMDGSQISSLYDPTISTMKIPVEDMSEEIIKMLLHKIERPGSRIQHAIFDMQYIEQQTTNRNAPLYIES